MNVSSSTNSNSDTEEPLGLLLSEKNINDSLYYLRSLALAHNLNCICSKLVFQPAPQASQRLITAKKVEELLKQYGNGELNDLTSKQKNIIESCLNTEYLERQW